MLGSEVLSKPRNHRIKFLGIKLLIASTEYRGGGLCALFKREAVGWLWSGILGLLSRVELWEFRLVREAGVQSSFCEEDTSKPPAARHCRHHHRNHLRPYRQ